MMDDMFRDFSRARLAAGWCAAAIVIAALAIVAGAPLTISALELLVATCLVPPTVILFARLPQRAPAQLPGKGIR